MTAHKIVRSSLSGSQQECSELFAHCSLAESLARDEAIIRTFVRMRSLTSVHRELAAKVLGHEGKLVKNDRALRDVCQAVRQLMKVSSPGPRSVE